MPPIRTGKVGEPFMLRKLRSDGVTATWEAIHGEVVVWLAYWRGVLNQETLFTWPVRPEELDASRLEPNPKKMQLKLDQFAETWEDEMRSIDFKANYIPTTFAEGGRLNTEARRMAKALYVTRGGFQAEKVIQVLPGRFRQGLPWSYCEQYFTQSVARVRAGMNQLVFTKELRIWTIQICLLPHFATIIHRAHHRRQFYVEQAGTAGIYAFWSKVLGDCLNLPYIFNLGRPSNAEEQQMQKRMRVRLVTIFSYCVDSVFIYELNRKDGLDLTNREKMMGVFSNIWRENALKKDSCEVKWGEWAILQSIGAPNRRSNTEEED